MAKFYEFSFYTINSHGDWLLYLTKLTGPLGRSSLLKHLKSDGYVYNRSRKAYFQTCPASANNKPVHFACVITHLTPLK